MIEQITSKMSFLLRQVSNGGDLFNAMSYSAVETGGKRIRPILLIECAMHFNHLVNLNVATTVGAALEFVHISSLIHDDLPLMDNDDFRRGLPTCHKKFGEVTAFLAGSALTAFAFEVIGNEEGLTSEQKTSLMGIFARFAGHEGLIMGQQMDMKIVNNPTEEELITMFALKCGGLFAAAFSSAGVITNALPQTVQALQRLGIVAGILFQIADDFKDFSEGERKPANIVFSLGRKVAQGSFLKKYRDAQQILSSLDIENGIIFNFFQDLYNKCMQC